MKLFPRYLLNLAISAVWTLAPITGNTWLKNLTYFSCWMMVLTCIGLAAGIKVPKSPLNQIFLHFMWLVPVAFLIASGWFWCGGILLLAYLWGDSAESEA